MPPRIAAVTEDQCTEICQGLNRESSNATWRNVAAQGLVYRTPSNRFWLSGIRRAMIVAAVAARSDGTVLTESRCWRMSRGLGSPGPVERLRRGNVAVAREPKQNPLSLLSVGCRDPDFDVQTDRCGDVAGPVQGTFAELPVEQIIVPGTVSGPAGAVLLLQVRFSLQLSCGSRETARRVLFGLATSRSVSVTASETFLWSQRPIARRHSARDFVISCRRSQE